MFLPAILETERLVLRPLSPTDATSIQKLAGDWLRHLAPRDRHIADTTISIPHPYPDGEAERYISKKIAELKTGCSVTFAIESKIEAKFIGIIEIRDKNKDKDKDKDKDVNLGRTILKNNSKEHLYQLSLQWTGNNGEGTLNYKAYARAYETEVSGKPIILGSSYFHFMK